MIPTSRTVVPIADRVGGGPAAVTNATFVVSGGGTITDVDARIGELRHPYLGDLTIELIHAGETVMLFNPPDALDGDDIVDAVFDSDSATPVFSAGPGPATGTMRPQDAAGLNRFDGLPAAGVWTLRITDLGAGDAGVAPRVGRVRCRLPVRAARDPGGEHRRRRRADDRQRHGQRLGDPERPRDRAALRLRHDDRVRGGQRDAGRRGRRRSRSPGPRR